MNNPAPNRLVVLSIWAEDVPTTAHFYKDVLRLKLFSHHHGDRPHFKIGDGFMTILKGKPSPAQDAEPDHFPLFALETDDLNAAVERLHKHGVETPNNIETGENTQYLIFNDPAGNLIELVQFDN